MTSGSVAMSAPPRLDAGIVRRALREAGLRPRHGLSQVFLADIDVLEAILELAAPGPGRRILEIGPGLGILTGGLLAAGTSVTAIELDRGLAARLREEYAEAIALDVDTAGGSSVSLPQVVEFSFRVSRLDRLRQRRRVHPRPLLLHLLRRSVLV